MCWAKYLDLDEHVVQQREPLQITPVARAEMHDEIEASTEIFGRRKVLLVLLGGSFASLVVGFVGPIGSLGPEAPRRAGPHVVEGRVAAGDHGRRPDRGRRHARSTSSSPSSPRAPSASTTPRSCCCACRPTCSPSARVDAGALDGWVAYSKICSHAGCSVGLFGIDNREPDTLRQLVCPCHQSIFDPADAARPVGGPAPRPLPQLALAVDAQGYLVAQGDFSGPVGPLAWDEA